MRKKPHMPEPEETRHSIRTALFLFLALISYKKKNMSTDMEKGGETKGQ
jgi:hypothetical protein